MKIHIPKASYAPKDFRVPVKPLPETFLLGSHICRVPMPEMDEMLTDIENLKKHGYNLVKIQTHWAIDEPLEGKFEFWRYDELLQKTKELGMYVYMGFTLEQAPAWLFEDHPDCRMVGKDDLPIKYETQWTLPADGKPGPCYDHPAAMEKHLTYITEFVKYFSKYENILVWNTWQEIAYWPELIIGTEICYCGNTLEHFRTWLREIYRTLENLNKLWGSNFGDWRHVTPRREFPIGLGVDKDFKFFIENIYIANVLQARYRAIKEADPMKRNVFAHKAYPVIGSGQDWTYARCQDFMGTSNYPAWSCYHEWDDNHQSRVYPPQKYPSLYTEIWSNLAMSIDYIRSSNPDSVPVWGAEFQGGPVMGCGITPSREFHKGRVPSGEDMSRWMLTSAGAGVTAISFWVTRAEVMAQENSGFSLLDSVGDTTDRFEATSKVGQALQKYPDLFALPSKPKANAAIVVNEENYQYCKSFSNTDRHLVFSTRGWYHLLWRNGYPVDFISIFDISEKTSEQYQALIMPFPLSLSDEQSMMLKKYVENGGNLICEGAAGRMNENGYAVRGELSPVIAGMAGVKHKDFTMVREPGGGRRWTPEERTWGEFLPETRMVGKGEFEGMEMWANYYLETFSCINGTPVFMAGNDVCGVVNRVGKGKFWLIGSFIGHNGTAYFEPSNLAIADKFMNICGVRSQKIGELLVQKRIGKTREAWIITNPTGSDVVESFDATSMKNPQNLVGEMAEFEAGQCRIELKSLDVAVIVFEKLP